MQLKVRKVTADHKNIFLFFSLLLNCILCFAQSNDTNWFPFQPDNNYAGSRINMKTWLDVPAGKHGFAKMNGSDIRFEDGTSIKFWGVNIASNRPFLPHDEARKWTEFLSTYGINAVRFHKFTWDATNGVHSTQLTKEKWENFDYFNSELKKQGIYYAWSHIYGHRVLQGDSSRVLAYNEVANTKFPWSHLNGTTSAIVNFADDLQALNIELTINMLNHFNPYNGLRYADDPALAYIELQNEDDIFWGAIEETLKQTPTYKNLLCKKFSLYLKKKYGTQDKLEKAWGANVLPSDQSLQKQNIYPQPNHGFFSARSEQAWKQGKPLPQHVIDKADFLATEQLNFYTKFVKAIRKTGYKGLIVSSCWQAGTGIAHLLNLYTDAETGVVDRHNYSGGGTGHTFVKGKINNAAMVNVPGSGLLSTGFQQVGNRPFFISEWMSLIPNEWTAEAAPIIATYGIGLQGWDGSYAFAMDYDHFTSTIQSGHGVYNVTSPLHLGLYPALSSMIYRKDIKEGAVVADRKVSISELRKGNLPFLEKIQQEADVKNLTAAAPLASLAAGKVILSFVNNLPVTPIFKFADLIDTASRVAVSSTQQLKWYYADKGYFTIDSKGTQGMVGFCKNKSIQLTDFNIQTTNEFAVVLFSSLDKTKDIAKSKSTLITCMARAKNTKMQMNEEHSQLLDIGEPPILLEAVNLEFRLNSNSKIKVHVLDHTGKRTGELVEPIANKYILNGARYHTMYYEIEKE